MKLFLVGLVMLVTLIIAAACSSGGDGPVANCGQNGVKAIHNENNDTALVVCKNGRVYELSIG